MYTLTTRLSASALILALGLAVAGVVIEGPSASAGTPVKAGGAHAQQAPRVERTGVMAAASAGASGRTGWSSGSLKQARRLAMRSYVSHAPAVTDMSGVRASTYKGRYYSASADRARRCILMRESHGNYAAVNPTGSYQGGYQVSRDLGIGATWMMLDEHKLLLGPKRAKHMLAKLRGKPVSEWNRYWQDSLFFTVFNASGPASGARHWHLAGSAC